MYPVIALIGLTVFMWVVAMWATIDDDDSEENHDVKKPEKSSGEHDQRKAA